MLIGGVFHVVHTDNTGEFDPYYIERMKNALSLMQEKGFVEAVEEDLRANNTFTKKSTA